MSKHLIFLFCFLLIFIFSLNPVSADVTLHTGDFDSVTEAFESLPDNSGIVTLKISKDNLKEFDSKFIIPGNRGVTTLTIIPDDGKTIVSLPEIERICANGIPLTIEEGIVMENASIYGGSCVSGEEAHLESSDITIAGSVGFVFGGGFAENGGSSSVEKTSITLTKSGLVYFEIFGGGHAYGNGSRVTVNNTTLTIHGTADYVLGGGFAEEGGISECENTYIQTNENSSVPVALFTGGSASGPDSLSTVENAKGIVAGHASWAFSGDFAFGGGKTRLSGASRLEILSTGTTEIAYMGSFSSDPGSDAFVNTAELMNCGTAGQIIQDSQSTDGGKAVTQVKALFPCATNN